MAPVEGVLPMSNVAASPRAEELRLEAKSTVKLEACDSAASIENRAYKRYMLAFCNRTPQSPERRTPNAERRTPNAERRTPNAERRTLASLPTCAIHPVT
jgi:hypothetical protein